MTFKAIVEIDQYKVGDVIPEDQALAWNAMYVKPVAVESEDSVEEAIDEIIVKHVVASAKVEVVASKLEKEAKPVKKGNK